MTMALAHAKRVAFGDEPLTEEGVIELVRTFGSLIEPQKAAGWRMVPATFSSGDRGEKPENIDRTMTNWAEAVADDRLNPTEAYYYFEKIHPYADGNGRVGHCLWAVVYTRQTGVWPDSLPPDVFGQH